MSIVSSRNIYSYDLPVFHLTLIFVLYIENFNSFLWQGIDVYLMSIVSSRDVLSDHLSCTCSLYFWFERGINVNCLQTLRIIWSFSWFSLDPSQYSYFILKIFTVSSDVVLMSIVFNWDVANQSDLIWFRQSFPLISTFSQ